MTAPKALSTAEIREKYLHFFEGKGHLRLPSYSTISPDSTTLFTVAGMQPFKPQFMGAPARFSGHEGEHQRVTTAQKCLRVGDIENVGRTLRHCSLLEMLGNFSFGDYFKREALLWAWEFLTSPEWLGLDKSRLYATIYDADEEAYAIWTGEIGLDPSHILRFGADENFWPADAPLKGPNGPCGPCSEIFYDRGPAYGDDTWADYAQTRESARFLEIWNNVFPQYDRQDPQPDGTPVLADLPFKNIDTGMGLERIATVVQDVYDFYANDVFAPIVARVAELSGQPYGGPTSVSHRVVAEHIRSVSMVLADGSALSNTGRGYVIRKILRRASRHAYLLGLREPVLYSLVPLVVEKMGGAYPELVREVERVQAAIRAEEERFLKTLESGTQRRTPCWAGWSAATPSPARMCSPCTTPTASRSTSRRRSPRSTASPWTRRATPRAWSAPRTSPGRAASTASPSCSGAAPPSWTTCCASAARPTSWATASWTRPPRCWASWRAASA